MDTRDWTKTPTQIQQRKQLGFTEKQILSLLADGLSNQEIGLVLGITHETVKTYIRSILGKMGARNRTHAVSEGYRTGLLGTPSVSP